MQHAIHSKARLTDDPRVVDMRSGFSSRTTPPHPVVRAMGRRGGVSAYFTPDECGKLGSGILREQATWYINFIRALDEYLSSR